MIQRLFPFLFFYLLLMFIPISCRFFVLPVIIIMLSISVRNLATYTPVSFHNRKRSKFLLLGCAFGGMGVYLMAKTIACIMVTGKSGGAVLPAGMLNFVFLLDILLLTPVAEELLFRGCLMETFEQFYPSLALPISTVLFAVAHWGQGPAGVCFAAVCGFWLSFLYKTERKLSFSVIMHQFINLSGYLDGIF